MTSLICTSCSRGAHLSCRRPECQCPCRQQLPPVLHEIAADLDQPEESEEGAVVGGGDEPHRVSIADDKLILAKTAITQDMLACPLQGCTFFIEVPPVPVSEDVANALGMTGHGLAHLHAEQSAWHAAGDMRAHLAKHTVEDWLTRFPRTVVTAP